MAALGSFRPLSGSFGKHEILRHLITVGSLRTHWIIRSWYLTVKLRDATGIPIPTYEFYLGYVEVPEVVRELSGSEFETPISIGEVPPLILDRRSSIRLRPITAFRVL